MKRLSFVDIRNEAVVVPSESVPLFVEWMVMKDVYLLPIPLALSLNGGQMQVDEMKRLCVHIWSPITRKGLSEEEGIHLVLACLLEVGERNEFHK